MNPPAFRVLVAGGGTGGHFFPGLAVVEELRAQDPGSEVLFVGTERGIEARVCPREGLSLRTIQVQRLKGGGWSGWIAGLLRLPRALLQSWRILREFRPDVVLGVGGYASGPAVRAAALTGRPTVILEQNARPGMTNRLLGRVARRVVVALEEARGSFPAGRTVLLGNPVRQSIGERLAAARANVEPRAAGEPPHLLVVGGSQGARGINRVLPAVLTELQRLGVSPRVRHGTGRLDLESVRLALQARGLLALVETCEFIEDMAAAYSWADLVICRAGATTLFELAAARRPAVLIPFPYAADNHQEANARAFVQAGAALLVRERELEPPALAATLAELFADGLRLQQMGERAGELARPRAARQIVALVYELGGRAAPAAAEEAG